MSEREREREKTPLISYLVAANARVFALIFPSLSLSLFIFIKVITVLAKNVDQLCDQASVGTVLPSSCDYAQTIGSWSDEDDDKDHLIQSNVALLYCALLSLVKPHCLVVCWSNLIALIIGALVAVPFV